MSDTEKTVTVLSNGIKALQFLSKMIEPFLHGYWVSFGVQMENRNVSDVESYKIKDQCRPKLNFDMSEQVCMVLCFQLDCKSCVISLS